MDEQELDVVSTESNENTMPDTESNSDSQYETNQDRGNLEKTENSSESPNVSSKVSSNVSSKSTAKLKYTPEERMQHSFKKQFHRQSQRHQRELAEKDKMLSELQERLDRLENPDKYRPKTRSDFEDDDSYIDHLVQTKLDAILQKSSEEYDAQQARLQEEQNQVNEYRSVQQSNIERLFPTNKEREVYYSAVKSAIDAGLGKLLDADPNVAGYIMRSDVGPKLMYRLATDRKSVERIFRLQDPMDRAFAIRELAKELTPSTRKPLGRPGQSTEKHDLFSSNKSILDYLSNR